MVSQRNRNYKFKVGANNSSIANHNYATSSTNFGLNTMIGGSLANKNSGIGYLTKRVGNTSNSNDSAYATNAAYHQTGSSS